jgi:hypothetical protein
MNRTKKIILKETNNQKDVQMKKEALYHLLEMRKQCSFMSL